MKLRKGEAYSFVPAACFYPKHAGLGVYVRYKGRQTNDIIVKQYRPNFIWVDCPDREILLVSDHNRMNSFVPMDCNYDEYFDLNYMDESGNDDVDMLMFNHLQHEGHHSPEIRRNGLHPTPNKKINYIADSGGFQLMTGKVEFIDPKVIAEWYSKNIDWGMVLDIPITDQEMPLDMVRRLATIQKMNSDMMLDNLDEAVELINIVHGISPQQKQAYGEIVLDDRIRRLAMGGMYYQNIVFTTNDLYTTLMENTHYKHLHILGVYNVAQLAIIIRLANSPINNMFITSDASTPLQSARSKLMHSQLAQKSPPKRVNIGDADRIPSVYNYANCHCKVCRSIKYLDVLGSLDGATSSFLLAYHNMIEVLRMTRQMNDICATASHKEYKEFVKGLLRNHRNANYTYQSLDFIDYADTHGIEAARRRYQHYLNISSLVKPVEPTPLFGHNGRAVTDEEREEKAKEEEAARIKAEQEAAAKAAAEAGTPLKEPKKRGRKKEEDDEEYEAHNNPNTIARLIETYEKFHKDELGVNAHGKKIKNREKDKKGSGRAAGVIKGAGLKSQLKKKAKKAKEKSNGPKA